MNTKLRATLFALLCSAAAQAAVAAESDVTQDYVGTVLSSEGTQADAFPVGATVMVTTTFDTAAPDVIEGPVFGYYLEGLKALTVEVPGSGFQSSTGTGELSLANDLVDDVSIQDYLVGYTFKPGEPTVLASIVQFKQVLPLGSTPAMLDSDAVPTQPLVGATDASFEFWTDIGYTLVRLELVPLPPTLEELVTDAKQRISELVGLGLLNQGVGVALVAKLDAIGQLSAGNSHAACGPFTGLTNQVRSLPRRTPEQIAVADELQAMVAALATVLEQC